MKELGPSLRSVSLTSFRLPDDMRPILEMMRELVFLQGSTIKNCIIGCNSYVGQGCKISETIVLGNDNYTNDTSRTASRKKGEAVLGIGEHRTDLLCSTHIQACIH